MMKYSRQETVHAETGDPNACISYLILLNHEDAQRYVPGRALGIQNCT